MMEFYCGRKVTNVAKGTSILLSHNVFESHFRQGHKNQRLHDKRWKKNGVGGITLSIKVSWTSIGFVSLVNLYVPPPPPPPPIPTPHPQLGICELT